MDLFGYLVMNMLMGFGGYCVLDKKFFGMFGMYGIYEVNMVM